MKSNQAKSTQIKESQVRHSWPQCTHSSSFTSSSFTSSARTIINSSRRRRAWSAKVAFPDQQLRFTSSPTAVFFGSLPQFVSFLELNKTRRCPKKDTAAALMNIIVIHNSDGWISLQSNAQCRQINRLCCCLPTIEHRI